MPPDVYFKYLPQLLAVHAPLLRHVVNRLESDSKQIELSFNQMNIYEHINAHNEDYTYHTYSMAFPAVRLRDTDSQTRMIFAENNECSQLLFADLSAVASMFDILKRSWSELTETIFSFITDTDSITAEKMEVLFTVHYWDSERQVQLFKLIYFEDTMRPAFTAISRWHPPKLQLIQVEERTYTI
jgi:hypothetical protein